MENKPKSKAFIITFIIVILILLIGYIILRNMGSNESKSDTFIGKIFAPLLGSSKEKELTPIENNATTTNPNTPGTNTNTPGTTTNGTNNPGTIDNNWGAGGLNNTSGGIGNSSGGNTSGGLSGGNLEGGGLGDEDYSTDNLDSIPKPGIADVISPNGQGSGTDTPGGPGIVPATDEEVALKEALCPVDDPLSNYFTDQNKKDLDNLLRQFYLIAPSIRTADDIKVAENEILENTSFGGQNGQLDQLINDCIEQKAAASYTGPQTTKDNPFYQGSSPYERETYLPIDAAPTNRVETFPMFEKFLYIW